MSHDDIKVSDHIFVRRPIVAIVISIVLIVFGLVALKGLPVAMYPNVVPPEIQVTSTYTGADSVSVEQSVTAPLEQKINGVENSIYVRSINSNDGVSSIRATFKVGADLDMANVLVQNRVSEGQPSLPEDVKRLGVTVKKSLSFPLLLVAVRSPNKSYDSNFLSNYALININDEIARINGVGQVNLLGGTDYAMRIWVNPSRLSALDLSITDITKAIQSQNTIVAGGKLGAEPAPKGNEFTYSVRVQGRLKSSEEFENIIIKSKSDGSIVRVRDVARVELGAQNYNAIGRYNEAPAALVAIYQVPGSNALDVANQIKGTMERLSKSFPPDLEYTVSLDTTKAVTAGINEIIHTLIEAMILVILVVFIFLQNWRATLIPILTVPVSLIATFAVFPLLGIGINTLSLLGLVLAIGIVVDDAIVVVEAVIHHIEHGASPRDATNKAMQEVAGPVMAIALILTAVFVPVVFMGGITGMFYTQFAVTISVSVLFSALVALSLCPALCSIMLKPATPATGLLGKFFKSFNNIFDRFTGVYGSFAGFLARKLIRTGIVFAVVIFAVQFFGKRLPAGFIPEEDQGYILVNMQLPDASSLQQTDSTASLAEKILLDTKGIESVSTVTGFSLLTSAYSSNSAFFFIWLNPWEERTPEEHSFEIIRSVNQKFAAGIPNAQVFAFGPPAIPGLGTGSGFSFMLQDRAGKTPQDLAEEVQRFIASAKKRPEIGNISTVYRASVPQIFADVDREKAYKLGVPLAEINSALGAYLGGAYVNDFNEFGRLYKIYIQAEAEYRDNPDDLKLFYVKSSDGSMVSLSNLVSIKRMYGPEFTNRFNLFRAAELVGAPAKGYSSTQALDALEEVAKAELPDGMAYSWNAMSYQERNAPASMGIMLLGVFFVFLILAAQYESWSLPFSVLLGTPFAVMGALGGLWLGRIFLGEAYLSNIFAQIGILTLVGLAAKNAILIVEFARAQAHEGKPPLEAALHAAKLRFRPILMTAFAFILGVVPLALASGSGAEGRKVMGLTVLSGMLIATILGVLLVPALFVFIEKLSSRKSVAKTAVTVSCIFLISCSLAPDYQKPDVALPSEFSEQHKSGDSVANLAWWDFFKDEELNTLIRTALENNKNIKLSAKRIEEARAQVTFTRANQFPFVDIAANAGRFDNSSFLQGQGPINNFNLLANLAFEVDVFGKLANATDAQKEMFFATEYAYRTVTLSLVSQVADFYFQLLDINQRLAITGRTIKTRHDATDIIRKRLDKGTVPELDVNQAEIEEYESKVVKYSLERQRANILNALRVLLGGKDFIISKDATLDKIILSEDAPAGLPAALIEKRPDILQAEAIVRAGYEQIGVARAMQLPSFSLLGTLGFRSGETSDLFSQDGKAWVIGGGIISPLINWHQNQARVDAEVARRDQSVAQYEQTVLLAVQEVENSLAAIRTYKLENEARGLQIKAARNASRLSRARYDDGVTSYLEVLDSNRSEFSTELSQSASRRLYLTSFIQLYKALGGGWVENANP